MSTAVNHLMNQYVLGYSAWAGIAVASYCVATGQTSRPELLVLMPFIAAGATQLSMKLVYAGITFFLDTLHAMADPDIMILMLSLMSLGMIVAVLYTCVRIVRASDSNKPTGLPTPSPEPAVPASPPESEAESEQTESTDDHADSEQSGDSSAVSGEEEDTGTEGGGEEEDAGADGDTEDNVSEEEKN
jgi:hypothetical protein